MVEILGTQFDLLEGSPAVRSGLAVLVGLAPPALLWINLAWRHWVWDWRDLRHARLEVAAEVTG